MFEKLKQKMAMKKMPIEPVNDPQLAEYLRSFQCERCHNHCPLSNIRCGGGLEARMQKMKEFQKK